MSGMEKLLASTFVWLRLIGITCLMGLTFDPIFAQGLLSFSEFRAQVKTEIRAHHPEACIRTDRNGNFVMGPDRKHCDLVDLNIDAMYGWYLSMPENLTSIIDLGTSVAVDNLYEAQTYTERPDIERLIPLLLPEYDEARAIQRPFAGPHSQTLLWDNFGGTDYVTPDDLRRMRLTKEEAWAVAYDNIRSGDAKMQRYPLDGLSGEYVEAEVGWFPNSGILLPESCTPETENYAVFLVGTIGHYWADIEAPDDKAAFYDSVVQYIKDQDPASTDMLICEDGAWRAEYFFYTLNVWEPYEAAGHQETSPR